MSEPTVPGYVIGDALDELRKLPDGFAQCCVTSPPYWGLRDYGHDGQLGLESTPEEYVAKLVAIFAEVRRVLRDDGTAWVNLGDSYAMSTKGKGGDWNSDAGPSAAGRTMVDRRSRIPLGLKPKDLCGIPWRVAFALQADGWYLRSDIIWSKPNPMPESVTDRPTKAHEYVFLLSKSPRYFYDADAVREGGSSNSHGASQGDPGKKARATGNHSGPLGLVPDSGKRNRRTVWTVATQPYSGAHFACFPPKLIEPCIMAGTSERGCCAECGAPMVRDVESGTLTGRRVNPGKASHMTPQGYLRDGKSRCGDKQTTTTGWSPSCSCDAGTNGCMVLDPFLGSGTVGEVCEALGRQWFGIELNPEYEPLIRGRTKQLGLFGRISSRVERACRR